MTDRVLLAKAWDEGHVAGAEDAGRRLGWSHRATNPPYNAGRPLPDLTPNPYRASTRCPECGGTTPIGLDEPHETKCANCGERFEWEPTP